jgi:hypothetical protein
VCVCVKGCNVACVCEPSPIVPWRAHDVRAHASSEISLPTHPVVIVSPGAPDPCYARCICTCIAWSSPVRSGKIAIPGPVCAPVGSDRVVPWPEIATPPTAGVRVTGCAARRGAHRPPPPLNRLPAGPASEPSSHGGGTSPGGRSHGFCSICASATSGAALFFFCEWIREIPYVCQCQRILLDSMSWGGVLYNPRFGQGAEKDRPDPLRQDGAVASDTQAGAVVE